MFDEAHADTAFVRAANLETSMMYMGNEPPLHVHLWEQEIFHVLEGEMELDCADQVRTVSAGETIFLPKGKAHAF